MLSRMSEASAISSTVHVVRHGEVHNPESILYGRQPGWRLSERGIAMAQAVADWSKELSLGAIHASPLERAQQTASPIALTHKLDIQTDDRLIEAANIFEGKPFAVGDGVLKRPGAWRHLWNPWRPSWGEPYKEQIALVVSHQLPIWILRSSIEGRPFLHDPRKRQCSLASVTSLHFDASGKVVGLTYSEPAQHLLPEKKK
jgi:broad specificity phosphatase PhoE